MESHKKQDAPPAPAVFGRRRPVAAAQSEWVKAEPPDDGASGPLVISPLLPGVGAADWAGAGRALIEEALLKHGSALFRRFEVGGPTGFEQFAGAVSGEMLEYRERSSPRHRVRGHVYTSTDYPAHQGIFFHNENSYQRVWPMRLFFFCNRPASEGGQTPTADTRLVLRLIGPEIVSRFEEKGCMYVRNYDEAFGLPWREVFGTDERGEVERYCHAAGITFEWTGGDRLRTRAVRAAVATHPRTGERVWFNHIAFFHVTTLEPSVRDGLLAEVGEEGLPANTYYGDGTPVEAEVLEAIRSAYARASASFDWEAGDILLLDNMLTAHSRRPFAGPREILVAMSEPSSAGGS
jgi:alpha-ketoglutarate-dependent taurine dioxygenase